MRKYHRSLLWLETIVVYHQSFTFKLFKNNNHSEFLLLKPRPAFQQYQVPKCQTQVAKYQVPKYQPKYQSTKYQSTKVPHPSTKVTSIKVPKYQTQVANTATKI